MRAIIAGSRGASKEDVYCGLHLCPWASDIKTVLSGHARGADMYGEEWARENGLDLEIFPAKWQKYGSSAGLIRNARMVLKAKGLVAIWNGVSRGTKHIISLARKCGLRVFVYNYSAKEWV
jgi:hypothetical protein